MSRKQKLKDQLLAENPTEQQEDAIFTSDLEFLLRAAPGSGKTWTSCRRFIWRGINWPHNAGGLALLSFTNAAIKEFKETTNTVGRNDLLSNPNYVGTFDAFVEKFILNPFGHLLGGSKRRPKLFIGPRPGDRNNSKLKAWPSAEGPRTYPIFAWEIIPYPDRGSVRFKSSKGTKLPSSSLRVLNNFISLGYYTHEQRVFWACVLLFNRPQIACLLARRFPEILVDEAQDSNVWLLKLLDLIRNKGSKVTLIGDPDQCIYEFALANYNSLIDLKDKWGIPEKPLSQSFRCNSQIASAVRNVGQNSNFTGCGECTLELHNPIIICDSSANYNESVDMFNSLAERQGIDNISRAILCRGHGELEKIKGNASYNDLTGLTKQLAKASFLRDYQFDYKKAFEIIKYTVRELTADSSLWDFMEDNPDSREAIEANLAIWKLVKSSDGLPAISNIGSDWLCQLRHSVRNLLNDLGQIVPSNLNSRISGRGLRDKIRLPLFQEISGINNIRRDTIHQVKGESIDAVLVLGTTKFWNLVLNSILSESNTEERRLAYVAMTRARHLLVVGLPESHYRQFSNYWQDWGFVTTTSIT